ncbi:MAG: hypothetical protein KC592_05355 [Nitrospira sp.]|nr:hypothetical protein [Nitrospira sp.]
MEAVWNAFGKDTKYATLGIIYINPPTGAQARYGPDVFCGAKKKNSTGNPARNKVSTKFCRKSISHYANELGRFTWLSNGFSKKVENFEHAVAFHYMHFNFSRIHKIFGVTTAMGAGVANHDWELEEIMKLLD